MRLLVVEDEPLVAELIQSSLERGGHAVDVVNTGREAIWLGTEREYDAIILDVVIPPPDGFEVTKRLRAEGCWSPILLLTGRNDIQDRVAGLDAGADDYLSKPFHVAELEARLRALTRRPPRERPVVLQSGDLHLDPTTRKVERNGQSVRLSPKEFVLLELFLRHPGEVLSRQFILEHGWDFAQEGGSNVVDVYVGYLRRKIDLPFGRSSLETVRGVGYRLNPET